MAASLGDDPAPDNARKTSRRNKGRAFLRGRHVVSVADAMEGEMDKTLN